MLVDTQQEVGIWKNEDLAEFLKEPDGSDGFQSHFDKGKQSELISKSIKRLKKYEKRWLTW